MANVPFTKCLPHNQSKVVQLLADCHTSNRPSRQPAVVPAAGHWPFYRVLLASESTEPGRSRVAKGAVMGQFELPPPFPGIAERERSSNRNEDPQRSKQEVRQDKYKS
jgi:hypothetical protein